MRRLFNSMLLGAIVIFVLLIFDSSGATPTSLFLLLFNPTNYEVNVFYSLFQIGGLVSLTGGIVIGIAAFLRQDWLMRAGFVTTLSSIVLFPFVDLFRFVVTKTNYISTNCINSPVCSQINAIGGLGQIFAFLFVSPLFLYSLWNLLEYIWRGDA